jgi:hypothetical protein
MLFTSSTLGGFTRSWVKGMAVVTTGTVLTCAACGTASTHRPACTPPLGPVLTHLEGNRRFAAQPGTRRGRGPH